MKIYLAIFMAFLSVKLVAMNDSFKIADKYESILHDSHNSLMEEPLTFAFKNDTGVTLKMRGRFGPTKEDPLGYICDENNPKAAQIFILRPGNAIKFSIKKKYLPLRVRVWHFDFTPDSDMDAGKPVSSSKLNVLNSIMTIVVSEGKHDFNISKNIISLKWDGESKKYKSVLEEIEEPSSDEYQDGYANNYEN